MKELRRSCNNHNLLFWNFARARRGRPRISSVSRNELEILRLAQDGKKNLRDAWLKRPSRSGGYMAKIQHDLSGVAGLGKLDRLLELFEREVMGDDW